MFSCANWQRGCRGRCDLAGGKCKECSMYNLRHCPQQQPLYRSKLSSPINLRNSTLADMYNTSIQPSTRQDPTMQDGIGQ